LTFFQECLTPFIGIVTGPRSKARVLNSFK
jgi:hypothetical protein